MIKIKKNYTQIKNLNTVAFIMKVMYTNISKNIFINLISKNKWFN